MTSKLAGESSDYGHTLDERVYEKTTFPDEKSLIRESIARCACYAVLRVAPRAAESRHSGTLNPSVRAFCPSERETVRDQPE